MAEQTQEGAPPEESPTFTEQQEDVKVPPTMFDLWAVLCVKKLNRQLNPLTLK